SLGGADSTCRPLRASMTLRRGSKSPSLPRSWSPSPPSSAGVRPAGSGRQSVHSAGMSDRLPSGKTTRTRRTPRRRMLLIAANDWPSKAWRSRVIVTESGTSRRWVVCGRFLRYDPARQADREAAAARDLAMVRYADDFVVLCDSMEKAQEALALIRAFANANGLTLHPDKTHIGDCRIKGQGFEFLGYRFEAGHRLVRKKSLLRLRDRIRAKTKRTSGQSLARTIAALNPTLKGWFGYFKHATSGLKDVDAFVRRRLRAMLRKQAKRHGCG